MKIFPLEIFMLYGISSQSTYQLEIVKCLSGAGTYRFQSISTVQRNRVWLCETILWLLLYMQELDLLTHQGYVYCGIGSCYG